MELTLITFLMISNWVFATVCAWMEGVLDDTFYYTEWIAGRKKHRVYMVLRGCYWIVNHLLILYAFEGRNLLFAEVIMVVVFLTHFRAVHGSVYHMTRNALDRAVSPKGFRQDDDGLSGSFWDSIIGHTYNDRIVVFVVGSAFYAGLIICLVTNAFNQL